jgi:hypothetical protein
MKRLFARRLTMIALVTLAPWLTACETFDMDKLDVLGLSKEKPLPGDRKPLFPQGVPGVTQGIPPEYLKENHQQPQAGALDQTASDAAAAGPSAAASSQPVQTSTAAEPPAEKPKPKPRRTVRRAAKPPPPPPAEPAQPAQAQPAQPWPAPGQQQQQADPWAAAPPAGSFSR